MKKIIYFSIILALLATLALAQSVSPSGAFTYSVPIEVPPGTGGIQPNLSLNYNSQGGNGFLGMGWSLGGLSVITRDTSYDVTWNDSTDHFVYNGQKLIPDVYDADLFYTENYNGQRIKVIRNSNGFIQTWEVTQQDGTRLIYGMRQDLPNGDVATKDGYIAAVGKNGAARLWALRQVIDLNGNYYLVDYREDPVGGDYYPDRIVYTFNDEGMNAYKAVVFGYDNSRADHYPKYIPSLVDLDERMDSVEVRIGTDSYGDGGSLVRSYGLEYEADSVVGTSRLVAVQEFGSDGESANPKIVFEWLPETVPLSDFDDNYRTYTQFNKDAAIWIQGDFNGDGFNDEVVIYDHFSSKASTAFTFFASENGLTTYGPALFLIGQEPQNVNWQTGDVNNDGKTDLICIEGELIRIFWGSDSGLQYGSTSVDIGFPSDEPDLEWFTGDFNGDSRTDIIAVRKIDVRNLKIIGFLGTDIGFSEGSQWVHNSYFNKTSAKWLVGDFTGDGYTDVIAIFDYATAPNTILGFQGANEGLMSSFLTWAEIGSFDWHDPKVSWQTDDYNNDGFTDLLAIHQISSTHTDLQGYLGTPNGMINCGIWNQVPYQIEGERWHSGDFDGDGLTDIISLFNYASTSDKIFGYLGCGKGFRRYNEYWQSFGSNESADAKRIVGDFDGDGISEMYALYWKSPNTLSTRYIHPSAGKKLNQIYTIHLPQGGQINIDYTPAPQLNNQSGIPNTPYTSAIEPSQSTYPNIADKSSRYLATAVTINNGLNDTTTTNYEYYNGKTRTGLKHDRQSLGFQYTKTINSDGSSIVTEYFQEDRLELAGMPKLRHSYGSDGKLYAEQQWDYNPVDEKQADFTDGFGQKYKQVKNVRLADVYQRNYNGGETYVESKTSYQNYDGLNNPAIIIQQSDTSDSATIIKTITNYGHNYNNWITKPYSQRTESADFDGQVDIAKKVYYFYDEVNNSSDWTKGKLTQISEFYNQYGYLNKTMTYDSYGNLETITDPKGTTTSTITYDPNYHMYPISKTNAKGHRETFKYDSRMRLTISMGYNGAGTSRVYDAFGRVIGTYAGEDTNGDGNFDVQNLLSLIDYDDAVLDPDNRSLDVTNPEPRRVITKAYTSSGQSIHTYVYYDGLGRILQQKTKAVAPTPTGNIVFTTIDYYYDEHGREKFVTIPYFSDTYIFDRPPLDSTETPPVPPNPYKSVEYDTIGRVVKNINSDSTSNKSIYELKKTWYVDENDRVSAQEIDGRKILSHIYSGEYNGDVAGLDWSRTTITEKARGGSQIIDVFKDDQDNTVQRTAVKTTNDMLGRTLTQEDQSLGLWSYKYDANSNLIERTDAKGQVLSFTYDELNRLTGKYYGQIDQAHPALNQLRAAYYYDGVDTLDDDENSPDFNYGYCKGLLTQVETYKDGVLFYDVKYVYDIFGRVTNIVKRIAKDTDVTPVEYVTASQTIVYDRANRITQVTYPGGEIVTYSYDAGGQLISVIGNRNGETVNYGTNMTYTALGKMKSLLQGNGVTTDYGYYDESGLSDPANNDTDINLQNTFRLKSINITKGSTIIANTHYEYDRLDNILKKTYEGAHGDMNETFSYDHQNRLISAVQSKGRYNYIYDYSENNNINIIESLEAEGQNSVMGNSERYYVYNAPAGDSERTLTHAVKEIREGSLTGPLLSSYTYDENGNMTSSTQYTTIEISAKAAMANALDEEPIMMLHINGKKPIEWKVTNLGDFHTYRWVGYWNGSDTIDVVFANGDDSPDSSLIIDWIKVNGTTIQAENPAVVYDKGTWNVNAPDGIDTVPGTETLDVQGALRFTTAVTSGAEPQNRQLTFDQENRLVNLIDSSNHNNFYYNEGEERIKKTDLNTNTSTYYFFDNYQETWEDGAKKEAVSYYFANNLRLAQRTLDYTEAEPQDQLLYNHTDHLGSAVVLTDVQGNVVYAVAYDPYGRTYYTAGVDEPNHKYTDQEKDATGLYYYGARYYDPEIGRFISPDSVLAGLNRYAYCFNNPVKYIDPTGNTPKINGPADYVAYTKTKEGKDAGLKTGKGDEKRSGYMEPIRDSDGNIMSVRIQDSKDKTIYSTIGMNGDETLLLTIDYKNNSITNHQTKETYKFKTDDTIFYTKEIDWIAWINPFAKDINVGFFKNENGEWIFKTFELCNTGILTFGGIVEGIELGLPLIPPVILDILGGNPTIPVVDKEILDLSKMLMASEHTKRRGSKKKTNDKHTKPRPGRGSEKKRQKPGWKKNR